MEPLKIGALRVSAVVERAGPTRPTFLFPDASPTAVDRHREWLAPHFVDEGGRFLQAVQSFVVEAPGLTVLVDTCIGNDKPRAQRHWHMLRTSYLDDLAATGFVPESIDVVLCTHLHVDHVGWNTRLDGGVWVPTFPRARYLFERSEWDYWSRRDGDEYGPIIADSVRPIVDAGLAELVSPDHRLADELALERTPGHTPGHVSLRLSSRGEEAVITGDLMHAPIQCAEPAWQSHFDADPDRARATRREFLERCANRDVWVLGTHFHTPTAGHVIRHGSAWRFRVA